MVPTLGKFFIVLGGVFILLGLAFLLAPHIPFLGKLPGDFYYEGKNTRVYFPLVTCILLSILITLILNIFGGWR